MSFVIEEENDKFIAWHMRKIELVEMNGSGVDDLCWPSGIAFQAGPYQVAYHHVWRAGMQVSGLMSGVVGRLVGKAQGGATREEIGRRGEMRG